ncbi:MAG: hypothetical protein GKS06_14330 [Acidobacteria bacterium]|nr:hypothetical protein [Acidobacteriota bacterium]
MRWARGLLPAIAATLLIAPIPGAAQNVDLGDLYKRGITFEEFLSDVERRSETWESNYENGAPTHQAVEAARAVGAPIKFLVVAEDWCHDSANTVPYLVRLAEQVEGWDVRVLNSSTGRAVMNANRTPDGRASTPTIVVLDQNDETLGVFVERPAVLQDWFQQNKDEIERRELMEQKSTWYAEDAGEETLRELIELARGEGSES